MTGSMFLYHIFILSGFNVQILRPPLSCVHLRFFSNENLNTFVYEKIFFVQYASAELDFTSALVISTHLDVLKRKSTDSIAL